MRSWVTKLASSHARAWPDGARVATRSRRACATPGFAGRAVPRSHGNGRARSSNGASSRSNDGSVRLAESRLGVHPVAASGHRVLPLVPREASHGVRFGARTSSTATRSWGARSDVGRGCTRARESPTSSRLQWTQGDVRRPRCRRVCARRAGRWCRGCRHRRGSRSARRRARRRCCRSRTRSRTPRNGVTIFDAAAQLAWPSRALCRSRCATRRRPQIPAKCGYSPRSAPIASPTISSRSPGRAPTMRRGSPRARPRRSARPPIRPAPRRRGDRRVARTSPVRSSPPDTRAHVEMLRALVSRGRRLTRSSGGWSCDVSDQCADRDDDAHELHWGLAMGSRVSRE